MERFYALVQVIYNEFHVVPCLFGKLAIQEFFNQYIDAKEISLLIPDSISENDWKEILTEHGYLFLDDFQFTKDGYMYRYGSFDKNLKIAGVENVQDLMKCILADVPPSIQEDGKQLAAWVSKQAGFYLFGTEELEKIYREDEEIFFLIQSVKGGCSHG